jgi:hypothetical protein
MRSKNYIEKNAIKKSPQSPIKGIAGFILIVGAVGD